MLVKTGIIPFLLYNFNIFTSCIGESITPIHLLFTNTFELCAKYSGEHSKTIFNGVLDLNHLIIG